MRYCVPCKWETNGDVIPAYEVVFYDGQRVRMCVDCYRSYARSNGRLHASDVDDEWWRLTNDVSGIIQQRWRRRKAS